MGCIVSAGRSLPVFRGSSQNPQHSSTTLKADRVPWLTLGGWGGRLGAAGLQIRAEMPARQISVDPNRRVELLYWELLSADKAPLASHGFLIT